MKIIFLGPLVEGAFVLATEAHDDDGCPHVRSFTLSDIFQTLEHLVFMGSENYPYKVIKVVELIFEGVLDRLANRCFARGTNAWTDTDHTAYTLTTVN